MNHSHINGSLFLLSYIFPTRFMFSSWNCRWRLFLVIILFFSSLLPISLQNGGDEHFHTEIHSISRLQNLLNSVNTRNLEKKNITRILLGKIESPRHSNYTLSIKTLQSITYCVKSTNATTSNKHKHKVPPKSE